MHCWCQAVSALVALSKQLSTLTGFGRFWRLYSPSRSHQADSTENWRRFSSNPIMIEPNNGALEILTSILMYCRVFSCILPSFPCLCDPSTKSFENDIFVHRKQFQKTISNEIQHVRYKSIFAVVKADTAFESAAVCFTIVWLLFGR